jgi:hypothetical protein
MHVMGSVEWELVQKVYTRYAVLSLCCWPVEHSNTVGPVNIQTSASDFFGKEIYQTWARIHKKYLKRANFRRSLGNVALLIIASLGST